MNKENDLKPEAIKTLKYLNKDEINAHLENVEYIIMAAPSPDDFKDTPIHFSIFLNTSQELPKDIEDAVFNKFLNENGIKNPKEVLIKLMPVGFSKTMQETLMPLLLIKQQDISTIPNRTLLVMDFLADSDNFKEAKEKNLTGWSYCYNN